MKIYTEKVLCLGCVWPEAVRTGKANNGGVERIADVWIDDKYGKRMRCQTDGSSSVLPIKNQEVA